MAGLGRQRWKEGSAWIGRLFMRRLREAAVVVAIGVQSMPSYSQV